MSRLAPGRAHDMRMLLERRSRTRVNTLAWTKIQLKIDDLVEEGKCAAMHSLRFRLVNAARASDNDEVLKISRQIDQHIKQHHRKRYMRGWVKKG